MIIRLFILLSIILPMTGCFEQRYTQDKMCGGRLAHWLSPSAGIGELAILQPITVTSNDRIIWNGTGIGEETLSRYLHLTNRMNPTPQIVLRVEDGASCGAVNHVRAQIDQIIECQRLRGCGEGTGWRRWPGARPEA